MGVAAAGVGAVSGPMTLRAFQKHAEEMFRRSNPGASILAWVYSPRRVKYPTGLRGLYGRMQVTDGGVIGEMVADYDEKTGWSVRGFGPARQIGTQG